MPKTGDPTLRDFPRLRVLGDIALPIRMPNLPMTFHQPQDEPVGITAPERTTIGGKPPLSHPMIQHHSRHKPLKSDTPRRGNGHAADISAKPTG
jgi:hypothetical protein